MKPGFALSLSVEGIRLLSRAAGGWREVGVVSLDDPELTESLAALRQQAVDLSDPAFRTKLIIPNDQIRYLTVQTGHVATADRIEKVRNALDGATPYAIDELVYDICVDGLQTHVAAVARETLEEAENFALEHRFNPVCFVAAPGDEAFLGEPFFGPSSFSETALLPGERVEPDEIAVVVLGPLDVAPDQADVISDPEPEPEQEPEAEGAADTNDEDDAVLLGADEQTPALGFSSRRATYEPENEPALTPAPASRTQSTIAPSILDDEADEDEADTEDTRFAEADPDSGDRSERDAPKTWATRFFSSRSATAEAAPRRVEPLAPELSASIPKAPPVQPAEPVPPAPRPIPAPSLEVPEGPEVALADYADERTRMTVFGMRDDEVSGNKPRHLGLILTGVLLLFLMGIAAWASVFLDDGLAALFERDEPVRAAQVPAPAAVTESSGGLATSQFFEPEAISESDEPLQQAALSDTDAAVLDALRSPQSTDVVEPEPPSVLDEATAEARYAVTGIWQRAPEPPTEPGVVTLDDLYLTSIDGAIASQDALALPPLSSLETDQPMGQVSSPAAPGSEFAFDENGRVIPTPEGALSPDGFTVYLGSPPVIPPDTPTRFENTPVADAQTQALLTIRPRVRPADLVEQTERAQLGGLTRSELAGVRPRLRPELAKTTAEADQTPTAQAVLASMAPRLRPRNMAQIVERADRETGDGNSETQETRLAAAASTAAVAATVAPQIPSSASVARAATVNNAINLRRVNLIGVYGTPSNRRALVRLPNGRYKKVQVGDRLDGGRISAIGEGELRYQKGGRNVVLKMPSG